MRLYTGRMRGQTSFLIKKVALSALTGGTAYGVAIWLAPPAISEYSVLASIAGITALAFLVSMFASNTPERREFARRSTPDTYYDYGFSITKDESWEE